LVVLLSIISVVFGCSTYIIVGDIQTNFPGSVHIAQSGKVDGLITVSGNAVTMQHNTRAYLAANCDNNFTPTTNYNLQLLGKSLTFDVNLSGIGCGCNAAAYLVAMPAYGSNNQPDPTECGDYYCDANQVCKIYCPEMDIIEANNNALQTTPHKCSNPTGNYYPSCDRGGCGANSYKTNPSYFGWGDGHIINTQNSFQVNTTYLTDSSGQLSQIVTAFSQDFFVFSFVQDDSKCGGGYVSSMSDAFKKGMVLTLASWGDLGSTMSWLDVPPCDINTACNVGGTVTFSNFQLQNLPGRH